jgi:hypothetical protein
MNQSKHLFLLRAYGDFLIAVHMASKSKARSPITLIASKHLEPFYTALPLTLPSHIDIRFHDFNISRQLMGCFTDRFLFHPHTITELLALRSYVRTHAMEGTAYLEQKKRGFLPRLFCGYPFRFVVGGGSVYQAYADFFSTPFHELENIAFDSHKQFKKLLIIPDARQDKRVISEQIIQQIRDQYAAEGIAITVARFKRADHSFSEDTVLYHDFKTLVSLIKDTDLLIGSDSMPVHLAQMLEKPHCILYPQSVPPSFFTPFALKHQTYFTFEALVARKTLFPDVE